MPPVLHLAPVAAARLPFTLRASISSAPRSPIPLADLRLAILPPATLRRKRVRLDELCVARWAQYSRSQVRSWILQGKVLVEGHPVTKAGAQVSEHADVIIKARVPKYVCRAGYKLEGALQQWGVAVGGAVALDAGLSTGGFTDCLLQHAAARVYGVDVGYGQVSERIRIDPRVVVMERTNLRHLSPSDLPEKVDLVTLDLSFISVLLVMPAVVGVMKPGAHLIVLVKPQFEARRGQVGGGGIVRSEAVRQEVLERVTRGIEEFGMEVQGVMTSPITGTDGNVEFLAHFVRRPVVAAPEMVPPGESGEPS